MNADASRPNIIVILTDDQGCWAMGCAGNREIRTPNLDRIAERGMRFANFFCGTPVCSAARASILTGTIASAHGVHDFLMSREIGRKEEDIEFLAGKKAYTDHLAEAGYVCGLSGKWHLGAMTRPQKSFSFWKTWRDGYVDYAIHDETGQVIQTEGYVTNTITDNALDFLETHGRGDPPFYLSVHYNAPHSPWRESDHPGTQWRDYYENCPFESVPYPPKHPNDGGLTDFFDNPQRRREKLSGYFAAVTAMDAGVGRILDWLDSNGLAEDTLVLFTSDNGMNMGHHGICGKGNGTRPLNMYDTSVKVPALACWPGTVPAGAVREDLLCHYDIFPTLLDVAGLENPDARSLPGTSFAPLLRGAASLEREPVVVYDEYGHARMIRTRRSKYVHRAGGQGCEFYDLVDDPDESENRIDVPACQDEIEHLRAQLEGWFARYVDEQLDGFKHPVTGCGQYDLAGKPEAFAQDWPEEWKPKP